MEYFDKRAVKILTDVYWSKDGWRTPCVSPSKEEFTYAKEKGLMFDETEVIHDDMIPRLLKARERVTLDKCAAAFLCSLSTRQIGLRSAVVSRLTADDFDDHKFVPSGKSEDKPVFKGYCAGCRALGYDHIYHSSRDINVYSFERIKFGGVSLGNPYYSMFDLETFPADREFIPTYEDIEIFRSIILAAEDCAQKDGAGRLSQKLKGLFKANKNERDNVIEILGWLGILKAAHERPGRDSEWVSVYDWRGEDGADREAVSRIFGAYLA